MLKLVGYALTVAASLGLAYAVATTTGKAVADSLNQSAARIEGASNGR